MPGITGTRSFWAQTCRSFVASATAAARSTGHEACSHARGGIRGGGSRSASRLPVPAWEGRPGPARGKGSVGVGYVFPSIEDLAKQLENLTQFSTVF
jgi:hypothetical protein